MGGGRIERASSVTGTGKQTILGLRAAFHVLLGDFSCKLAEILYGCFDPGGRLSSTIFWRSSTAMREEIKKAVRCPADLV
jgi:hypothetical protein